MRKMTRKSSTKARAARVGHEVAKIKLLVVLKDLPAAAAVRALLGAAQEIVDQTLEDQS